MASPQSCILHNAINSNTLFPCNFRLQFKNYGQTRTDKSNVMEQKKTSPQHTHTAFEHTRMNKQIILPYTESDH